MRMNKIDEFKANHATVWHWLETETTFDFARSLKDALHRYGSLTERQLAAAEKCAAKQALKAATTAAATPIDADLLEAFGDLRLEIPTAPAPEAKAPAIGTDKLTSAFEAAKTRGLSRPILRFEGFQASLAPSNGKNPGAIYVKTQGEYMGKITPSGDFFASRDCPSDMRAKIAATMTDPLAAAVAFGRRTGQCSCCGRELTNSESIDRGIGPICAEKFGF
jgi:hypothetical protein